MLDSLDTLIAFVLIMLVVSLLITIVVQMISSALNLRGLNLAKGLAATFAIAAPEVEAKAKELARFILKGRILSDSSFKYSPSWWRLATAVRPAEVFDSIHRIAIGKRTADAGLRENAQALLIALGMDKKVLEEAAAQIGAAEQTTKSLVDTASEALKSLPDEAVRTKVQSAFNALSKQLAAAETAAAGQIAKTAGAVDEAFEKFQYWTEICQERVQQWFTMHTRFLTVFFACIFAFWLQLDTVEIFKLVSSSRAVRDKLVAQATAIGSQAEKVLGSSNSVLQKAYTAWLDKRDEKTKTAVASISIQPDDTREKLVKRIGDALAQAPDKQTLLKDFNDIVDKTAADTLKEQTGDYASVKADFDKTGFDLFPQGNQGRWGDHWGDGWGAHFLGTLFSVGLLSLGAPFWYNTLKNLTSLRSTVAQNIAEEKKQEKKQPELLGPDFTRTLAPRATPTVLAPPTTR